MKILILGDTGAMGISLAPMLAAGGNDVCVTSRSPHKSSRENFYFVQGNAQDASLLTDILSGQFDTVIDFMSYSTEEFQKRRDLLLNRIDIFSKA